MKMHRISTKCDRSSSGPPSGPQDEQRQRSFTEKTTRNNMWLSYLLRLDFYNSVEKPKLAWRCCLASYVPRFLGVTVLEKAGQKLSERVATSFRQVDGHFNNITYCKVDPFGRPNISSKLSPNGSISKKNR
jgi:hypothetical protein